MIRVPVRSLAILCFFSSSLLHAQFYRLHGASVSVGAFGQFTTPLTTDSESGSYNAPFGTAGVSSYPVDLSNQAQTTTSSVGFLASLQFHPVAWAGVELNYGFTDYSERYFFDYTNLSLSNTVNVPVDTHEATAAYIFHPRHIPFQPFVSIGGGAVDFLPRGSIQPIANQWRGAGLLEAGFDVPMPRTKKLALRVEGRSLYYRSPDFGQLAISTHGWRVSEEPSASFAYRF